MKAKGTQPLKWQQTPLTWIECPHHAHYAQVAFANQRPHAKLLLHFCVCVILWSAVGIHFCIISICNKKLSIFYRAFSFGTARAVYTRNYTLSNIVQAVQCPFAGCYNVFQTFRIEIENFMCSEHERTNIFLWFDLLYVFNHVYTVYGTLCAWKHFTIN